jgi:hypothetical protein
MRAHRYLRAYLAGIAVPTAFLLVFVTGFAIARHLGRVPGPAERVIIFPMAVLPNLWGAWNVLYVWLASRRRIPIGLYGAALPLIVGPSAVLLSHAMGVELPDLAVRAFPVALVVVTAAYYLLWKYLVRQINEKLEIVPP